MPPKKKIARKEKPEPIRYVVTDRQGRLKYLPKLGEEVIGFPLERAQKLAEPAHPSHDYTVLSVEEWKGK